ncbi:MAG: hypothetical protein ACM3VT_02415 [Solirubrobacterales bacterium]
MEWEQVLSREKLEERGLKTGDRGQDASVFRPRSSVLHWFRRLLQSPSTPWVLSLIAVLVSLPALDDGFLNDDFMHYSILAGPSDAVNRLAERGLAPQRSGQLGYALSHTFVAVQPQENLQPLRNYGALPWWTYDGFRVAFWRPVASFTQWLDYRLFPQSPALMHLHSILWFAVAMLGIAFLYRRIASFEGALWLGGLAALMYLLDDNGYFPALWIANRNLLISLFFGAMAVLAHDRWRRQQWRPGAVLAPACLLVSVLATEGGIATFAYLFAYEVALDRGTAVRRALTLVPSAVVVVLWRLAYNVQGYGASGGGFYLDPVREPLDYALAVLQRGPFFLGGQWTSIPADLANYMPGASKTLLWALLAALTVLIPVLMTPMLRVNRRARFWLIGMYLAALPVCATAPMGRAMLFIGIGAFGVMAEYIGGWVTRESWRPVRGWTRHIPGMLFVVLLVANLPLAAFGRLGAPGVTETLHAKMAQTQDLSPAGDLGNEDLIVVNAPNPISFLYDPFQRALQDRPLPRGVRVLAPGFNSVELTRTGPNRVTVRALSNSLLDCQRGERVDFAFFYQYLSDVRSPAHPFRVGDRISLSRMGVEILVVDGRGFPVEAAFEFETPLEDASLKWLVWDWDDDVYRPLTVPPAGQSLRLMGPF